MVSPGTTNATRPGIRSSGPRLDPDAAAFVALTGATDIEGIDEWAKGIKALGYWSAMASYPMREAQNHTSTAALRMLGGYTNTPGTLVNGPTRGANGIILANGTQEITHNMPTVFPRSMFYIRNEQITSGSTNSVLCGVFGAGRFNLTSAGAMSFRAAYTPIINVENFQGWRSYAAIMGAGNSTHRVFINAQTTSAGSATGDTTGQNNNNDRIAGLTGTIVGQTTVPMVIFFEGIAVDHVAVYNLYKATLGKGLGLP